MIRPFFRQSGAIILLLFLSTLTYGQTNISGVINQYSSISAVDYSGNSITVGDPTLFSIGDQLLLIQMQGATIDETNTSSFGEVTAMGGAGSYELATVCEVTGSSIVLENDLLNSDYDPAGGLQAVTVPEYTDATVSAELTGQTWDGTTGGVLVFTVTNNLTLNAPINLDGKGFRGGTFENAVSNCNFFFTVPDYFYDTPNDGGGRKGESIAEIIPNKEYGRGAQAAGGGGGNDHNSGGGGGANAGAGGVGGDNISTGQFNCDGEFPGVGGKVPAQTSNRIFLGSGGGAGEGNNGVGTSGGNGGGIIIITTNTLTVGSSGSISANGLAADNTTGGDGGGGGGAGGSVYLETASLSGGNPVLSVAGGKGGDVDNNNFNRCVGPGGGGGGGLIRTNTSLPAGSLIVAGGIPGESNNSMFASCTGFTGSAAGSDGRVVDETIPVGNTLSLACSALPVSWQHLTLEIRTKTTLVNWSIVTQESNNFFTIERNTDGQSFTSLSRTTATQELSYSYLDPSPLAGKSYYRVRQTDFDGSFAFSPVAISQRAYPEVRLSPSLARPGTPVLLQLPETWQNGNITATLIDGNGKQRWSNLISRTTEQTISAPDLPAGLYYVHLRSEQLFWTGRLVIIR